MLLEEYADAINVDIDVNYYAKQKRWTAKLQYVEVMDGCVASSVYGEGSTPDEALAEYARKIAGEKIRLFGGSKLIVPDHLVG